MKSVEENNNLREKISQLFDNPLRKEFINLEQMVEFFGYSKKWVKQQMAEGNLPYHCYGRDGLLFYIPEIRQAILSGRLAPIRKVKYDNTYKNKKRREIPRSSLCKRGKTLEDIRSSRGCREMGEFHSLS